MISTYFALAKQFLEVNLHLSRDALHVHIGILIFFAFVLLLKRHPGRFRLALLGLFGLCLINETMDAIFQTQRFGYVHWEGSVKDIVNTMIWPVLIVHAGPTVIRLSGLMARQGGAEPTTQLSAPVVRR